MKIHLHPPFCLHELGLRENNEDSIYPPKNKSSEKGSNSLFMVCDGVGGAAKGEVASRMVCDVLSNYLLGRSQIKKEDIDEAIILAEEKINNFITDNVDAKGMATTLTLLSLQNEGVVVAHIGDSRIYQIRDGKIIFKTFDHSFVNELVAKNIISEIEALNHPKRNVVTKAIMGAQYPQKADVTIIKDIERGDYFFMCTDGILESINESDLLSILNNPDNTNAEKIEEIKKRCNEHSRDNFSAYLLQVDQVEDQTFNTFNQLVWGNEKSIIYLLIGVLIIVVLTFAFLNSDKKPTKADQELIENNVDNSLNILEGIDTNEIDNNNFDSLTQQDTLNWLTNPDSFEDKIETDSIDTYKPEF